MLLENNNQYYPNYAYNNYDATTYNNFLSSLINNNGNNNNYNGPTEITYYNDLDDIINNYNGYTDGYTDRYADFNTEAYTDFTDLNNYGYTDIGVTQPTFFNQYYEDFTEDSNLANFNFKKNKDNLLNYTTVASNIDSKLLISQQSILPLESKSPGLVDDRKLDVLELNRVTQGTSARSLINSSVDSSNNSVTLSPALSSVSNHLHESSANSFVEDFTTLDSISGSFGTSKVPTIFEAIGKELSSISKRDKRQDFDKTTLTSPTLKNTAERESTSKNTKYEQTTPTFPEYDMTNNSGVTSIFEAIAANFFNNENDEPNNTSARNLFESDLFNNSDSITSKNSSPDLDILSADFFGDSLEDSMTTENLKLLENFFETTQRNRRESEKSPVARSVRL